jgi:hypothetical protein
MPIKLPDQRPPVVRDAPGESQTSENGTAGIDAAQSACGGLTGLARQMCRAATT